MTKLGRALCVLSLCLAWTTYPYSAQAKCKPGVALTPGDHNYDMMFGGMKRTFLLHVPPSYDGKKPVPLVFDLHGSGSTGPSELASSRFSAVADANGFLVVAPNGYMNSWNGDIAFGAAYMMKLDDVGLMKALIAYIAGLANVNRAKVYSTGLSNGAAMSNTLGCQAADTFAAIAPVADPLDIGLATCMPAQPISVLGFHGYNDDPVPYEGGKGTGPDLGTPFPSIPDTLIAWGKIMGCTGMPEVETISGRNKCEIYRHCGGDAEVGYCSLEGTHILYQQSVLNVAERAWKFFDKHALPLPDADGDGVDDQDDNCVHVANPDQADADGDCIGDACQCSKSADCDDGKFCNGAETCVAGACSAAAAPCPADQSCDEASRKCGDGSLASRAGAGGAEAGAAGGGVAGAVPVSPAVAGGPATSVGASAVEGSAGVVGALTTSARPSADSGSPAQPASSSASASGGCSMLGRRQALGRPGGALTLLGLLLLARSARRRASRLRRQNDP
ncbi:MAG TPA: PHB depolymerase family esterase [Polyangiales bacterium]|nr:PHB depolymerase family esterase [Polyangiales bacterium]